LIVFVTVYHDKYDLLPHSSASVERICPSTDKLHDNPNRWLFESRNSQK